MGEDREKNTACVETHKEMIKKRTKKAITKRQEQEAIKGGKPM